ncbi:hypothetical protein [Tunicatimonas pelagia]|uniref:hypothetical protein n=1 Tax=Tunicatimonas pelagia TaxID=931531 RepID=UPI0026671732|nr:hypothetical protein [Tunicatimonas pelagia]WKN42956.1 hypothetical protein P0M28_28360 [Tunicatimonas pelagia]
MSRQPLPGHTETEFVTNILETFMQAPEEVSQEQMFTLLNVSKSEGDKPFRSDEPISTADLRKLMLRIFDQNDDFKFDNANVGYLNTLNNISQRRRNKAFFRTIRSGANVKRIVAEGDSWFEHPVVYDVIDWLSDLGKDQYAIYSIARGGDFLTNMLEEREYITELSLIRPEVFLLSAGGIELVNGRRVALMVDQHSKYVTEEYMYAHPLIRNVLIKGDLSSRQQQTLIRGMSFLTKEYFVLLAVLELSYKYLIKQLRKKFFDLKIITHGYDYTVPSFQRGPGVVKTLINLVGGNGQHFKEPMLLRGIRNAEDQRAISFAMIHLFNEMMVKVVLDPVFGRGVHHIDCRGYARDEDWHDELHLRPRSLKRVAQTYLEAINSNNPDQKIFFVRQLAQKQGDSTTLVNNPYANPDQ